MYWATSPIICVEQPTQPGKTALLRHVALFLLQYLEVMPVAQLMILFRCLYHSIVSLWYVYSVSVEVGFSMCHFRPVWNHNRKHEVHTSMQLWQVRNKKQTNKKQTKKPTVLEQNLANLQKDTETVYTLQVGKNSNIAKQIVWTRFRDLYQTVCRQCYVPQATRDRWGIFTWNNQQLLLTCC